MFFFFYEATLHIFSHLSRTYPIIETVTLCVRKSCNEDILSRDSDNYFLGLNYLRSITFQPGAQYFGLWTLCLVHVLNHKLLSNRRSYNENAIGRPTRFLFLHFCTEVQGDLHADVPGGHITFSVPDHTHRLTGQPQHQELHALFFWNSVWFL